MSAEPGEALDVAALDVLRVIWRGQGQAAADLDDAAASEKCCKKMSDVGFDDFAAGTDLTAAWRAKLRREGKIGPDSSSVADLVMGPTESRH